MIDLRLPLLAATSVLALALALAACGPTATNPEPPASQLLSGAPTSAAADPATTAPASGSPGDPCTLLTTEKINTTLGTTVGDGTEKTDDARKVVTCTWQQSDMLALVDVGLTEVDGKEAYQTNVDLAPAYFDGEASPIDIPGAEKAYLVIEKDLKAPVIGMLVGDRFVLVQATAPQITKEQGVELATTVAANMGLS